MGAIMVAPIRQESQGLDERTTFNHAGFVKDARDR